MAKLAARLIVSVDTEEEGLWSDSFRATGNTVRNIGRLPRFQRLCDELGVEPTYFINSPVATDANAVAVLKDFLGDGRCEIGGHVHPWNTAPLDHACDARRSYLCNLPLTEQREKLRVVTEQIADAFDRAPTSFRSGRYGLDRAGAALLAELGYVVDSSVCPFTDYSVDGGPDFRGAPHRPYWIGSDLTRSGPPGGLLEVPVSFGFNRSNFALAFRVHEFLRTRPLGHLRLPGVLDRLGVLQKIKFSPEKGDVVRLSRLARAYLANGAPCMVMMFHSSSLLPGSTPYVTTERELEAFFATLRATLEYCIDELGMQPATLGGFAGDCIDAGLALQTTGEGE